MHPSSYFIRDGKWENDEFVADSNWKDLKDAAALKIIENALNEIE